MNTNDTAGMQAGTLVMGYDPRTASVTVHVLGNPDDFEVVSDGAAVMSGYGDAEAGTEFAGQPAAPPRPICAASVQHNYRAGPHPGKCKPGSARRH